ncbi:MAG: efflux RND transporter periplasmic adaptor subunit [Nitrospira sp.]
MRIKMISGGLATLTVGLALLFVLLTSSAEEMNQNLPVPEPRLVSVTPVQFHQLETSTHLPGELLPYLSVDLYPKVTALLDWIAIDRGSDVAEGQVLARLRAPELRAQRAEAEAMLRADEITLRHLHSAAQTPGVIAENDLQVAEKTVEGSQARVKALKEMEDYLIIKAPFEGRVTERQTHPGALLVPGQGRPLFRIEQIDRLRLVVPVPEANVGGIREGAHVSFVVSAYPRVPFTGIVRRIAQSVDPKTRTMPVELDVNNVSKRLAPGMFAEVEWPVRRPMATTFVPRSAVVATTERTFVIRVDTSGMTEWVSITRGELMGELQEVFGDLKPKDLVVVRATDELGPQTKIILQAQEQPSDL